jgi:hypothetical protein
MRNSVQHRLGIEAIGSRQVIQALPDAARTTVTRLPVPLGARQSGDKLGHSFYRALQLRKNRIATFGNGWHPFTAHAKDFL